MTLWLSLERVSVDEKEISSLEDLQKKKNCESFILILTRFSPIKLCSTSGWISKKLCGRREFNSVCLEVQGIRLVQDKGIMLAL